MGLVNSKLRKCIKNIVNKHRRYAYHLDIFKFENNVLDLEFWFYLLEKVSTDIQIEFKTDSITKIIEMDKPYARRDVYQESGKNPDAYYSGYRFTAFVESSETIFVSLIFNTKQGGQKLEIGRLQPNKSSGRLEVIERIIGIDYSEFQSRKREYLEKKEMDSISRRKVDIIIPVYNGYKYLEKLFLSILQTDLEYRVIVIDDASPDIKVREFLEQIGNKFKDFLLIKNETNLGFVRSVNKGLAIAEHDIALVNTDVEVPRYWLERLMEPIFGDDTIASSTPFTNSGIICSFPNFLKDNKLFENMNVQQIDKAFAELIPEYNELPTGVGFCMGISYRALKDIGFFDEEAFGKGYGEENDWCQRAILRGYKNVFVENLFVYHNHGGSFLAEDKLRYIAENEKKLLLKHPEYNKDVAAFVKKDPIKKFRDIAMVELIKEIKDIPSIVAFSHSLGGGAASYLKNLVTEEVFKGNRVITVRYDYKGYYWVDVEYKTYKIELKIRQLDEIFDFLNQFGIRTIIINELVTYQNINILIDKVLQLKETNKAQLQMLLHDYYCICPSINLLDYKNIFCDVPSIENCKMCNQYICEKKYTDYKGIEDWRGMWSRLLMKVDEIIAFSNSSKIMLEKAYPGVSNIIIRPHQVNNLLPLNKKCKVTTTVNIGLLGILTEHKGSNIVREMLDYIKIGKINAKIILIGECEQKIVDDNFTELGRYTREEIPELIYRHDIDIFLVSSICPETFSYTAEEIMKLNMPIATFDIGAPAERARNYDKGLIISRLSGQVAVDEIIDYWGKLNIQVPAKESRRFLFITEQITFSSRYRVSHFREQLSYYYVPSDFVQLKDIETIKLKSYKVVVIYRCRNDRRLERLIVQAKSVGIPVLYDIDDYIFEYERIEQLNFLQQKGYKQYKNYSNSIKKCMNLCDGYITSTETLKEGIEESFPGKPVIINRNVASMQMLTLSLKAQQQVIRNSERVKLGYFSGSSTHNKDFELISGVLAKIMKANPNVDLVLAGHIERPAIFKPFESRIRTIEFMDWKDCPQFQASIDINLMPLENGFFHKCKSENKWTEAALVKVVTVASWNEELEKVMENGKTAFLCRNCEEWESILTRLINDQALRKEIGDAAYQKVLADHTTLNTGKTALDSIREMSRNRRKDV